MTRHLLAIGLACVLTAPALARPAPVPEGARYVAMGSSFAAGPGVGPTTPGTPARCGRGTLNYPNLLARKLKLALVDATCSGATTEHILGPWNELPPQIESVTADTRLVTITIGGNDVNFVGNVFAAACEHKSPGAAHCQKWRDVTELDWLGDEERLRRIVREVRRRAPEARVVFVDYITILPDRPCAAFPISPLRLQQSQDAARRLGAITSKVAKDERAELFRFSVLSKGHTSCSAVPWSNGAIATPDDGISFHPNRAGHAAAATGLAKILG